MSVSSSTHEDVWPEVSDWFWEQSGEEDETEADAEADVAEIQEQAAEEVAADSDEESEVEAGEAEADSEAAVDADPVETVDGIGPTYAERLEDAGIETTADLFESEAADLAEVAETTESRAQDWLEQAE